eukprot:360369-Prymnesium_polylepis.1
MPRLASRRPRWSKTSDDQLERGVGTNALAFAHASCSANDSSAPWGSSPSRAASEKTSSNLDECFDRPRWARCAPTSPSDATKSVTGLPRPALPFVSTDRARCSPASISEDEVGRNPNKLPVLELKSPTRT